MPAALLATAVALPFSLGPTTDTSLASQLRSALTSRPVATVSHIDEHSALAPLDAMPWRIAWQGAPDADTTPDDTPPEVAKFGAEGSMRWTVLGGFGAQVVEPRNKEAFLGLGLQYYIVDGFAFAPQVKMWGFFQSGEDAVGGSLDILFQWHIIRKETWSFFGDFGCGMLGTSENVPIGGSQFNFTPQAGVGFTFDIGNDRRAVVGVKWHHISNASLYRDNPGRDSILVYGGLNLPF